MIQAVFEFKDGSVTIHSENTKLVTETFNNGYFSARVNEKGDMLIKRVEFNEVHEPFPNQNSAEIIDTVTKFLNPENHKQCNEMGYTYKLNILLKGPQGSGKTSLINFICNMLIKNQKAIVFRIDNIHNVEATWALAEEIRKIQKDLIVFIMDEFEQYCGKNQESYTKSLLDGNRSIDNSMIFAATNYIDRIPDSIKDRPSRFRLISEIGKITSKEIIKNIIKTQHDKCTKSFLTEEKIDELVDKLESTTVDQIKNIINDNLMNIKLGLPEKELIGFNVKYDEKEDEESDDLKEFREVLDMFQFNEALESQKIIPK